MSDTSARSAHSSVAPSCIVVQTRRRLAQATASDVDHVALLHVGLQVALVRDGERDLLPLGARRARRRGEADAGGFG